MTTECTYRGKISIRAYGEDDDALFLDDEPSTPFAERFADDVRKFGNTVTVSYWVTDEPRTLEQLVENDALKAAGAATADYTQRHSDVTGYLWTDAECVVGGHDLLAELGSADGFWCYLTVRFGER